MGFCSRCGRWLLPVEGRISIVEGNIKEVVCSECETFGQNNGLVFNAVDIEQSSTGSQYQGAGK